MTFAIGPVLVLTKARAALPCSSCLFGLGEAAGMSGATSCPLKAALKRRLAAERPARGAGEVVCDSFAPCFGDAEADSMPFDAAGVRMRLS